MHSKRLIRCKDNRQFGAIIAQLVGDKRFFVVVDQRVFKLHSATLSAVLTADNCLGSYQLSATEQNKKLATVAEICDRLLALNVTRADYVIAVGGGITTDLAAFAAAITKRGVGLINVPTTLLGMVDAAIGGKAAVNTAHGKNSLGCFYPAAQIVLARQFLATLADEEWQNGRAECVKYSYLSKRFALATALVPLDQFKRQVLADIVRYADYKEQLVAADLTDVGRRRILNFGHSFGHALEMANAADGLSHGRAVLIGIAIALYFSTAIYHLESAIFDDYYRWLVAQNWYDERYQRSLDDLNYYLKRDKKNNATELTLILLSDLAEPTVVALNWADVRRIYRGYYREISHSAV